VAAEGDAAGDDFRGDEVQGFAGGVCGVVEQFQRAGASAVGLFGHQRLSLVHDRAVLRAHAFARHGADRNPHS
jgi:hypothetical protein